jgi:hypothetical protein
MHWAQDHVEPMSALRTIACNDRWAEAWPQIVSTLRQQEKQRRVERHHQRKALAHPTFGYPNGGGKPHLRG